MPAYVRILIEQQEVIGGEWLRHHEVGGQADYYWANQRIHQIGWKGEITAKRPEIRIRSRAESIYQDRHGAEAAKTVAFPVPHELGDVQAERPEQPVRHVRGQSPYIFQRVMQMRLGYVADGRETAFGKQAGPNPLTSDFDEPVLKIAKIHATDRDTARDISG